MLTTQEYRSALDTAIALPNQPRFGVLNETAAGYLPADRGIPMRDVGGTPLRLRPYAIERSGFDIPAGMPVLTGLDEAGQRRQAFLASLPGVSVCGETLPYEPDTTLIELRHSKVLPDDPPTQRTPEGHIRVFAIRPLGATGLITVFGVGELRPGHQGEGGDIYLGAEQVGERGLEPNAPVRFYDNDFRHELRGMRYLPFGAFDPAVAAAFMGETS